MHLQTGEQDLAALSLLHVITRHGRQGMLATTIAALRLACRCLTAESSPALTSALHAQVFPDRLSACVTPMCQTQMVLGTLFVVLESSPATQRPYEVSRYAALQSMSAELLGAVRG